MLYRTAMGKAYSELPDELQAFHSVAGSHLYTGRVTVTHGGRVARLVARSGGMPARPGEMPFRLRMTREGNSEIWERDFGGHITRSRLWLHGPGVLAERVGTSRFLMTPVIGDGALHVPITRITRFGLPVPGAMIESCAGIERVAEDGAIAFDVHASIRGLGSIIRYKGELRRQQ